MRGAVFFDVDGTLVPQTSSSQHLARFLGHLDVLRRAEDDYAKGRMDNREVSVLDAEGWHGHSTEDVTRFLRNLPLVTGIPEVVAWCREQELAPYLATLAWEPVGLYLCETFGFNGACGPTLGQQEGTYTGKVALYFDEFDKRDFALRTAHDLDVTLSACSAVGDSRSDLPLFAEVGFSVAFNASSAVQAVAAASVAGTDLRAVIPPLTKWLRRHQGRFVVVVVVRQAAPEDVPFLLRVLAIAADWQKGVEPRATVDVLAAPDLAHYVPDLGARDRGLVMQDEERHDVGAVWWRFFDVDDPGYGFVAPEVPEVTIGVLAASRRRGLGS